MHLSDKPKSFTSRQQRTNELLRRAISHYENEEFVKAKLLLQKVLKTDDNNFIALKLSGLLYHKEEQHEYSLNLLSRAISINPTKASSYHWRANVLQDISRYNEALADYDRAIAIDNKYADARNDRGLVLLNLGFLEKALEDFNKAIQINPNFAIAYNNRAKLMESLGHYDKAINDYDKAISLNPNYESAYFNKSFQLLRKGNFLVGWKLYERRWISRKYTIYKRNFTQKLWSGKENLNGKIIFLYWEQGFGDTIQFARYAKELRELGASVILEVQKELFELFKSYEHVDHLIAFGTKIPNFDFYCPLMSLPMALETKIETIPSPDSYLKSTNIKLEEWSERLGTKLKPRIGIVWSGSESHSNDKNRSLSLAEILNAVPDGFQIVSLQKDVRENDLQTLKKSKNLLHFGSKLRDFSDTAALCELMDVVVSVDTSVAHLAGALGKPTRILLPYVSDFRWLINRSDSPWYLSIKLCRQGPEKQWGPVLTLLKEELKLIFIH